MSTPHQPDWCYRKIRPVDISDLLLKLPAVEFVDTGGTNGWVAKPEWLMPFVRFLHPEGRITFTVMRKLPPYQSIPPHADLWKNNPNIGRRFHVPLLTHPDVLMRWPEDGVEVHLEAGWLYEVCYTKVHEVQHRAPVDRVHLHYNTVP